MIVKKVFNGADNLDCMYFATRPLGLITVVP